MNAPLHCKWNGTSMAPLRPERAAQAFEVGRVYPLVVHEERSQASHNHYFAAVHEAWKNLREEDQARFPSSEHLRKRALVDANFCDEEVIDCGSNTVAPNVGAAIRKRDDFAIIFIRDQFVIVRTAKSQSPRAMGKADFEKSKTAVLEILSAMVGVSPEVLRDNAGKAA